MLLALVAIMMPIGAWALNYTHKMCKTGITTLYVPFALELPEGVRAYIVTGVRINDDGTVKLVEKELEGGIPELTPVIIRGDRSVASISFPIATDMELEPIDDNNLLTGTLVQMPLDVSSETGNFMLYYTDASSEYGLELADWQAPVGADGTTTYTLSPNMAYLQLPPESWSSKFAAMLEALKNPHLQHTHGGCEICGQVTGVEAAWGASADDLTLGGTLDDAINAAAAEGSTVGYIQLQEDVETGVVINGGTFTLDLNGHTIGASDESHGLQIQGADTHVTLKGETEGSMVFANNKSSPTVNVIDGASVTIESGTYKNYYNIVVNNETDCSVTIIDGLFESTSSNAIANCGDLVIKGGTFTSSDGLSTISYSNGAINLSEYENITDISIISWIDPSFTPSAATILLPEGYCFFDSEGDPVGSIMYALDYSIGEEPDTKYTITFAANGGGDEMADGISYGKYSLPECTFTAPEGMMFKAWQIGEDEYQPGEVVIIEDNTTITAVWASLFEVSFEANGGRGSMDDIFTIADCTLPECTFTAPDGMMFKAWQIGEDEYQPGDDVTIEANTTITAVWTAYVPQIIIKMHDSAGDGWHGDAIVVKKNGKEIGIATIEDGGSNGIVRYDYDNTADYTFYWSCNHEQELEENPDYRCYPNECSFEIFIDDKEVFAAKRYEDENTSDCQSYEDGELICTIEHTACPHTSFNNGVCAECDVTGGYCGAETNEGGAESVRWAISEDGSILTILGEGAMADYKGYSNNPWWREYSQKITTIVICDGITRIGNDAFGDLDGITDIVIPSSVTTIGSNAFCGCASLKTVTLNKGLRVIEGNAFVQCMELTTITIPDGVTEIGVNAFNYCSNLASINIPHSVTTIGQSAFTANISTVYVSCSPQFEYTFGANTTIVYAEHEYEDGFCTVCGKIDGRIQDGEHESFYVEEIFENVDITYTRTLPNLMWNALYVPFEIPVSELEDNYDVAYVNDVHSFDTDDDGEIDDLQMEIIKITSGTLKANYPYLIRAKNEGAQNMELILDDATLCATEGNTVTCSSVFMQFDVTGTYDTMSQDGDLDILAISTDGSWKKLAEGTALKPFRLYLTLSALDGSPVKVEEEALTRMRIVIRGEEGNETGIDQITTSHDKQTTTYFDLSGRRVKTPVKGGLYIMNGKKVVY